MSIKFHKAISSQSIGIHYSLVSQRWAFDLVVQSGQLKEEDQLSREMIESSGKQQKGTSSKHKKEYIEKDIKFLEDFMKCYCLLNCGIKGLQGEQLEAKSIVGVRGGYNGNLNQCGDSGKEKKGDFFQYFSILVAFGYDNDK